MGVNIFTGGRAGAPVKTKANSKSQTVTNGPSKVPTTVSVNKSGILGKVAGFAKKALPRVASILPGPIGAIAKGLSSVFNDPEWWESIPGLGMSTNLPLQDVKSAYSNGTVSDVALHNARFAILDITSGSGSDTYRHICDPSDNSVTQYLMTEVRKVVNAVPLQEAHVYGDAFARNCTIYAVWRHLKKLDFMIKNGNTYLPNISDPAFPIFQTGNAQILQSTIIRLEEILRSSVRLPHTMCEYLSWRFGRVYKSNTSAKSGLVLYSPFDLRSTMPVILAYIDKAIAYPSTSPAAAQAVTDLYNAYYDHDQAVEIGDDTQFSYDAKEFLLRTNLDIVLDDLHMSYKPHMVILDSELDNPTTFMSSTISSRIKYTDGITSCLFPVSFANAYIAGVTPEIVPLFDTIAGSNYWAAAGMGKVVMDISKPIDKKNIGRIMAAKALDYYESDMLFQDGDQYFVSTPLSMDAGFTDEEVLGNTQLHAFGNLAYASRKTGKSKNTVATEATKDVAKLIADVTSRNVAVATAR